MGSERRIRQGRGAPLESMRALVLVIVAVAVAGVWAAVYLDLSPDGLWPGRGGLRLAGEFFSRAFSPALRFEGQYAGDALSLPLQAVGAAFNTVIFAAAALSLALVGGLVLGFLGSSAGWERGPGRVMTAAARLFMALMRSVHELIWAVLLLAAFGTGHLAAVFAIAIPYAGTLGKVFAEMIDEAPRDAADALGQSGANALQCFACGLVPRAAPDMTAYTFYRFECALRSSAVLGFFGFPTLGYYIAASFENLYYGEVWTYLYVLFALIAVVDWWSSRLRREVLA